MKWTNMAAGSAVAVAAALLGAAAAGAAQPAGTPALTLIHGQLRTAGGEAIDGAVELLVRIYASADAETPIYTETLPGVPVASSRFAVFIGAAPDDPFGPQLGDVFLANAAAEISLTVDDGGELPRRPLGQVPYAIHAMEAEKAQLAVTAQLAEDLACAGCVQSTDVGFSYAAADGKGGAASDLDCSGCVEAIEIGVGQIGSAHLQDGGVSATDVGFNYAGSGAKGGAATSALALDCVGCVDTGELADGSVSVAKLGIPCAVGDALVQGDSGWACQPAGSAGGRVVATHPIFGGEEGAAEITKPTWQSITKTIYHLNAPNPGLVEDAAHVEHWLVLRVADTINTCGDASTWRFWFSWAGVPGHEFALSRHWGSNAEGSVRWIKVPGPSAQAAAFGIYPQYWRLEAKLPSTCPGHSLRVFEIDLVEIERPDAAPATPQQSDSAVASQAGYHLGRPGGTAIHIADDSQVGIFQSSPQAKLHVGGDLRADSTLHGASLESEGPITAPFFSAGEGYGANVTAGTWYRIASNPGDRAGGTFTLRDTISSGGHSQMTFQVATSYNDPSGLSVSMLHHGKYGSITFDKLRVLHGTTYQPMYVEVLVQRTGYVEFGLTDNTHYSGWTPLDWQPGSVPGGYGVHEYELDHLMMIGGNAQALTVERDGDLRVAGAVSAANIAGSSLSTTGGLTVGGSTTFSGDVGIGATPTGAAKLEVTGAADVSGTLTAGTVSSVGEVKGSFFRAGQGNSANVTAGAWYRIAENPGSRAAATFTLRDYISSGGHSQLTFNAGISYNDASGISLTVVSHHRYGSVSFTKLRILERDTYEPQYLEVWVERTGGVEYSIYDNLQTAGWIPVDWTAGSVPAGYAVHEYAVDNLFVVGGDTQYVTVGRNGDATFDGKVVAQKEVIANDAVTAWGGLKASTISPASGSQVDFTSEVRAPFFKAGQGHAGGVSSGSWYRIASNTGDRAAATFTLRDYISSGGHSQVTFNAGISYNDAGGISLTLLSHHRYSTTTFDRVRLVERDTYDPMYLEVHVVRDGSVEYSIYDNLHANGWTPVDWEAGSVPAGYSSHEYTLDALFLVGADREHLRVDRNGRLTATHIETPGTLSADRIGVGVAAPAAKMDVRGQHYFSAQYTLAQIEAQATCIALRSQAGYGGGWTYAVRRDCSGSAPTCTQVCAAIWGPQPGDYLRCFNSLHIYGNQPHDGTSQMGLKTYLYNGCGGGCGPNYCCCSN